MADVLILAGSEVASLAWDAAAGHAQLRLAAAQVLRDGQPGHLPGVLLQLQAARCEGDPAEAFGRINEAQLRCGAGPALREWPLLQAFDQPLQLSLRMGHGATLVLHAAAWRCLPGAGRVVESHAC